MGVTAGAGDLSAGVFRTLVATGRSRLRLFAARIPGGLALVLPFIAVGFTVAAVASIMMAGSEPQPDAGFVARMAAWIVLQASVAFAIGLGVGSLFGSRGMSIGVVLGWMLAIEPLLGAISVLGSFRIGLLGAAVQRLTPSSPFVENGGPRWRCRLAPRRPLSCCGLSSRWPWAPGAPPRGTHEERDEAAAAEQPALLGRL